MTTQTYRRSRHRVPLLHTHLAFVTTYRPKVLTNAMPIHCQNTIREVCAELNAEFVAF